MLKPDFDKCTERATELLYKQEISDRILNIAALNYDKKILFESIQTYCQYVKAPLDIFLSSRKDVLRDGCTLFDKQSGYYIVLYNSEITHFEHRNWTLGHEIGHIYLEHTKDDDLEEIEAHFFASQLFMPEYSLYMMSQEYGRVSAEDIVEIFGVSDEAARKRIHTMKRKTSFRASKKDREIWHNQKERIDMYFHCKREGRNFRETLYFWNEMKIEYERQCRLESYI